MNTGIFHDRINLLVLSVGTLFFAASAYNGFLTFINHSNERKQKGQKSIQGGKTKGSKLSSSQISSKSPKLSSDSAVHKVTYVTKPEDCQSFHSSNSNQRPKLHAGALFKLIDIAAGVAARRHAGGSCVTISVDSVVLLKPIYLGDLIHVSASVNRAWGSSMEVGVRIVKESVANGNSSWHSELEYVSHSYLTFVAINKSNPQTIPTSFIDRIWNTIFLSSNPKPAKPTLAPIKASTRLESRRHLLAGRRRNKRLSDTKNGRTREGVSIDVKSKVREEMQAMMYSNDKQSFNPAPQDLANAIRGNELLRTIELEVLIQAWAQGEEVVSVHDGMVEVNMPGDEPLVFTEKEVRKKAKSLGIKLPGDEKFDPSEYRLHGSATPTWAQASVSPPSTPTKRPIRLPNSSQFGEFRSGSPFSPSASSVQQLNKVDHSSSIPVSNTLTTSMYIVFPQHTNSVGIIFGGNTMSWSEEVAIMACRKLRVKGVSGNLNWKTVSMDGLEFQVQVGVGELMILSAIVVRTYSRSCEVYVLAQAEDRQGKRRFTNDVLFTLAYCKETATSLDENGIETMDDDHITTQIVMPKGSALETFASVSQLRRQQRLELRQMLIRVYGSQESTASATEQ